MANRQTDRQKWLLEKFYPFMICSNCLTIPALDWGKTKKEEANDKAYKLYSSLSTVCHAVKRNWRGTVLRFSTANDQSPVFHPHPFKVKCQNFQKSLHLFSSVAQSFGIWLKLMGSVSNEWHDVGMKARLSVLLRTSHGMLLQLKTLNWVHALPNKVI